MGEECARVAAMLTTGLSLSVVRGAAVAVGLSPVIKSGRISVDEVCLARTIGWRDALMATFGITVQIFADFAGYSFTVAGTARLFGIELALDTERPPAKAGGFKIAN